MNVSVASGLKTLTFKTIQKWLTELQKTAQLVEHACQSARLALFQRVTSIRSIQMLALTAVHVQMLAQWVQS
jgi:response regulator of citrate/malate metabolism